MRLSEFHALMVRFFGPYRAGTVAVDHVFGALGGRTAARALAEGIPPRRVWAAVCEDFEVPESLHHGLPD